MKINKGQFRLSTKWENVKFNYRRGKGHLFAYMKNRVKWHYYPRLKIVSEFPDHIDIELSTACNLKCPMCYTITDSFKERVSRQNMSFDLFKKLVDECAAHNAYSIRLSFRGEPFLNPNIIDMIKYAKDKGIKEISTLSNMLLITPEKCCYIVIAKS